MEIWKAIPSLGGHYEASSLGRVRRVSRARGVKIGRCLTPQPNKDTGRLYIMATINYKHNSLLLGRVICETFHGPAPFPGAQADHIDEDFRNNRADNLQWLSHIDNVRKSIATGKRKPAGPAISISQKRRHKEHPESCPRGEQHANCLYSDAQVQLVKDYRKDNPTMPITKLSKNLNLSYGFCWRIIRGKARLGLNAGTQILPANVSERAEDLEL